METFEEVSGDAKEYYNKRYSSCCQWAPNDFYDLVMKIITGYLGSVSSKLFLDVGCGYGDMLFRITNQGGTAYGIDISEKATIFAKKNAPKAEVKLAHCESVPFKDQFFDVVVCLGSIEHFNNIKAGLKEILRVLKPSGYLVAVVPNKWWIGRLYEWFGLNLVYRQLHKLQSNQPIERELTSMKWRYQLVQAGFVIVSIGGYNLEIEIPLVRKALFNSKRIPFSLSYHYIIICKPK